MNGSGSSSSSNLQSPHRLRPHLNVITPKKFDELNPLGSVDISICQLRHSCGACPCESREQKSSRFQMARMSRNRLHLRLWIPVPCFHEDMLRGNDANVNTP